MSSLYYIQDYSPQRDLSSGVINVNQKQDIYSLEVHLISHEMFEMKHHYTLLSLGEVARSLSIYIKFNSTLPSSRVRNLLSPGVLSTLHSPAEQLIL